MDNAASAAMLPADDAADTGEATDGEKYLFWQIAKKLCSEKRREQRKAAMKAYRQCLEPTIVPTEILASGGSSGGGSGSAKAEMVDLGNLLLPPTTTKDTLQTSTSHHSPGYPDLSNLSSSVDNEDGDADSCVSDVTRELPDIDAPTLYPSLDCLDVEVPDLTVTGQAQGKLEVTTTTTTSSSTTACGVSSTTTKDFLKELDELYPYSITEEPVVNVDDIFADNHNNNSHLALSNCKPNKTSLEVDSASSSSLNSYARYRRQQKEQDGLDMEEMNNLLAQNMANLTLKSNESHEPTSRESSRHKTTSKLLAIAREGSTGGGSYLRATKADGKESTKDLLGYQTTLTSPASSAFPSPLHSYNRTSSGSSSPVPPRRRRSQASNASNTDLTMPNYKRNTSESTPVIPKRRKSLDSQQQQEKAGADDLWYSSSGGDRHRLGITSSTQPVLAKPTPQPKRNVSEASEAAPMRPQRRLSFDSRMSSMVDDDNNTYIPTREELEYEDMSVYGRPQIRQTDNPRPPTQKTKTLGIQKAFSRDESLHTPPRRRGSLESQEQHYGKRDWNKSPPQPQEADSYNNNNSSTGRHDHGSHQSKPGGGGGLQQQSGHSLPPLRLPQRRDTMAPTPEELGYNEDHETDDRCGDLLPAANTPRLPYRRNSFSSLISADSTIATWTLGLYRRRKSLESSVAPPRGLGLWGVAPDTTPSQPKRRFSGNSLMREQFAATESRWNCALSVNSRDNHGYFTMTTNTVSTLGLSSGGSGRRGRSNNQKESRKTTQTPTNTRRRSSWSSSTDRHQHNQQQQQQQPKVGGERPMELEIQPGLFVPLRGSQETIEAVEQNFVERTSCMACETKLVCIGDAEYVLCPLCKVVSPVFANLGSSSGGGVGLGIEVNDPCLQTSSRTFTSRRHR